MSWFKSEESEVLFEQKLPEIDVTYEVINCLGKEFICTYSTVENTFGSIKNDVLGFWIHCSKDSFIPASAVAEIRNITIKEKQ